MGSKHFTLDDLPHRTLNGRWVRGCRHDLFPHVSHLGYWGPLEDSMTGATLPRLGDLATMKTESSEDVGYWGVLPATLRSSLMEVWQVVLPLEGGWNDAEKQRPPTKAAQVDVFLGEVTASIVAASTELWITTSGLLDQAHLDEGITRIT